MDCIFCKIVKGDIPSYKIYEDDNFYAFLNIFPIAEGHTLVIPKKHYRWVWDVVNIGEYFEVCKKLANYFQEVTKEESVYSFILGEEVPHAHIHLVSGSNKQMSSKFLNSIQSLHESNMIEKSKAEEVMTKFHYPDRKI